MSALFTFTLLAKITLLLLGALGLDQLLRRRSAIACAAMWNAALLALAAIPLLCLTMPSVTIPVAFEVGTEQPSPQSQQAGTDATTFPAANLPLPSGTSVESRGVPGEPVPSELPRMSFAIPSIWQLLEGIYLAGAGVFALRLVLSLLAVRRLKRQATDIQDVAWQRTLQDCLSQIGSRAKIRLKQSSEISVPIACGWLTPTIVIPADLVAALSASARKGVLIHELVHLLRRDYPWQLLLRCLQVALWFHPLLWLAERRIHFVRERICDDFSIFILGDSEMYCDTLLDIAARCQSRLSLSLGLAIVRKGRLAQRLSAMEQSQGSGRYELSGKAKWAVGSAVLLLALVLSCFALQPSAAAKEPAPKDKPVTQNKKDAAAKLAGEKPKEESKKDQPKREGKKVVLTIKGTAEDENGNALVAATVYVFAEDFDPQKHRLNLGSCRQIGKTETKENGAYEFPDLAVEILAVPDGERRPETSALEMLAVTKDHKFAWCGPLLVSANGEVRMKGSREVLTKANLNAIHFKFRPTKPIVGRVLDDAGKSIEGAIIRMVGCRRPVPDPLLNLGGLYYSLSGKQKQPAPDSVAIRKSDVGGKFEFNEIPIGSRCVFIVNHPDHAMVFAGATNADGDPAAVGGGGGEGLKIQQGTVEVKMRRAFGVPVEVKLVGDDKPALGALVRAVEANPEDTLSPVVVLESVDKQGHVVLKLPAGKFTIDAQFGGTQYESPVEIEVDKTPRKKPVVIEVQGTSAGAVPGAKPKKEPAKEGLKEEKKDDGTKQPAKPDTLGAEPSEKDLRHASSENLKKLGIGMHTHHDVLKLFPAQSIKKDDKPLLSWRVKLLPFMNEQTLYDQFHLDEPWDSEHNKTLIPKMPAVFASPYETGEMVAKGLTLYQVPLSKGSLFEENATYSFHSIKDGVSHTILVVETDPNHAVTWTKPDDWKVDPKKPHTGIVRQKGKGFHALFADGAVHLMDDAMDAENILLLIGKEDEKRVPAQTLFLKE